ncbi:MAG TPA: HAMP domain-containing sensor histidine kinase [Polyangiaceae bacterium]|nr:HAMP domain-containing sensor histidine kinase [Polyangiaceae bacterium]
MRGGLRLQILLLMGGLLLLAFIPLFFAVATYTSVTLQQLRVSHARALGRAIAAHVAEARTSRTGDDLMGLLRAEIGTEGVEAIGVYDLAGARVAAAGEPAAVDELPHGPVRNREGLEELPAGASILTVTVPSRVGPVVAVLRIDDQAARAAPLVRLMGLYMALVGLALLVVAYFALTRLIVRPLDALARAAERVAGGARKLAVPKTAVPELSELGTSLGIMTERLIQEEDKLRSKIDEVERATERLKEAQDRLVRSERLASVGRLAAGLAHEIGNPISALMGLEDLVLAGGLTPEEEHDFLTRMRKETERIHRILRDLLQFARPAAAPLAGEAEQEPGDVETAARDTAALVAPQRSLKDVSLELELSPALPAVALGHEQLMQVILNLVMNAADAVGAGGRVRVAAAPYNGGVRLQVEDNGPGVDPRVQAQLFEPFVTTKEVGKGTGLGLAVCRGLVEAAGGTIALDREYGRGARFIVDLPKQK